MHERLPLFVYGTLRPGERNYGLVAAAVVRVESALMAGLQLWDLGPYPMVCEGPGRVVGELLTLDPSGYSALLRRVDALEGVDPAAPTRPGTLHYWRARRTALLPGCAGPTPEAWVYLAPPAAARQGRRVVGRGWTERPYDG